MAGRNPKARGRDMTISMLVLLVPIVLIAWFFTNNVEPEVEAVAVEPHLERALEESPYPVLHAVNLPEDWVPARVAWAADGDRWITDEPAVGNSWQLGYMAPNGIYIALQQRDRSVESFLKEVTRGGYTDGVEQEISGRTWEEWTSSDDRTRSLVWRADDMVAVVTGDTDFEQLIAFTGTLTEG